LCGFRAQAIDELENKRLKAAPDYRMSPAIQPVTVRAFARPAPGRIAGYPQR
jgi:hypothetical protein